MFKAHSEFPLHLAIQHQREDVVFLFLIEFNAQVSLMCMCMWILYLLGYVPAHVHVHVCHFLHVNVYTCISYKNYVCSGFTCHSKLVRIGGDCMYIECGL